MENKEIKFRDVLESIDLVFDLYEEKFSNKNVKFNVGDDTINLNIGVNDVKDYIKISKDESDIEKYIRLNNFLKLSKLFDDNQKNYGVYVGENSDFLGIVSPNRIDSSDIFILHLDDSNEASLIDINGYNNLSNSDLYTELFERFNEKVPVTYKEPLLSKIFRK